MSFSSMGVSPMHSMFSGSEIVEYDEHGQDAHATEFFSTASTFRRVLH